MGILDFLFGKSAKIDHPFFRQMLFVNNKHDSARSYFECRRYFKPSDKLIEMGIDADISGPTQVQVDFFRNIEDHYSELTNSIAPLIEDQFQNWQEDFKMGNFNKEFEPVYLRLPRCDKQPVIWEIAFESGHDSNHTFTLTMQDYKAHEILIDG